jgi:hypothetical protein
MIELVVRADPNPFHGVAGTNAYGAILFGDANGPDVGGPLKFFQTQCWMAMALTEFDPPPLKKDDPPP